MLPQYVGWNPRNSMRGSNPEWKVSNMGASVACNQTGQSLLLNGVRQGAGVSERVGSHFTMKTLQVAFYVKADPPGGVTQGVRVMIVLDKISNGTAPTTSTVLQYQGITAPRNLDYRKRFKIMWDKVIVLNQVSTGHPNMVFRKLYMKFRRPIVTDYFGNNTGGGYTDIEANALWIYAFGTELAGATDAMISFDSRVRYIDN